MEKKFGHDFHRVCPWGKQGDMKCDGFLNSKRIVFQCYAPYNMKKNELKNKIENDLNGAKIHWKGQMNEWIFVHNEQRGLAAEIIQLLEKIKSENTDISIHTWSFEELKQISMSLSIDNLIDLYGEVPSRPILDHLRYGDLQPVLSAIQRKKPELDVEIKAPSIEKIQANDLSEDIKDYLQIGRRKEKLVQNFFDDWHDPNFGEEVAQSFRNQYVSLKKQDLTGEEIFRELQRFSAGGNRGTPEFEAAVLAVMSYFFERCDIFEDTEPEKEQ